MNSGFDTENLQAVFTGGFIYICNLCGKIFDSLEELKLHLDETHEEFEYDNVTLDGPQFKVRKIKYYQDQVGSVDKETVTNRQSQLSGLATDLQTISIIDLIEAPLCQLTSVLEKFNDEQRELCL